LVLWIFRNKTRPKSREIYAGELTGSIYNEYIKKYIIF